MTLSLEQVAHWRKLAESHEECADHIFAVSSWGCAGTKWLANALNDCAGIFCVHEATSYWRRLAGARHLDGVEYLLLVGSLGSAAAAAGDVNSVDRADLAKAREVFGERFRSAILIRDPIPRLRSQMAMSMRFAAARLWDVSYLDDKFPEVVRSLPTGRYEERLFVHNVNMLNTILEEQEIAPIVRMEDVTVKPESLCDLVSFLTGGAVVPAGNWAAQAVAARKVNEHASSNAKPFTAWQRRVLEAVFQPEAIAAYRALGYEVDLDKEARGFDSWIRNALKRFPRASIFS